MKKKIIIWGTITAVAALVFLIGVMLAENSFNANFNNNQKKELDSFQAESAPKQEVLKIPLDNVGQRTIKKHFGIYVTPQNSPIQPEKFHGYHTGTDFEIFSGEENIDVPVRAVCDGDMLAGQFVSGYGGVLIQNCRIENNYANVLYGHLGPASFKFRIGEKIKKGDVIGILGDPSKNETGGERKHLHMGIYRKKGIEFRGYVNSESELAGWIDPCLYFCE